MTVRDVVLLYLLFLVGRDLVREVRSTFGERTVDLSLSTAVRAEHRPIDLAMAAARDLDDRPRRRHRPAARLRRLTRRQSAARNDSSAMPSRR